MMIGNSYHSYIKSVQVDRLQPFDVIVIGSGMGGLSTASFLAQAGKRVLLLEQHSKIGGFTHSFVRGEYRWDVGLHYVGKVQVEGSTLNKVFRYLSNDHLKWEPLDDIYDRAIFGSQEYEFPRGRENLKKKLKEYFPDSKDRHSIDKYFSLLSQVEHLGTGYYIEKTLPPFLANVFGFLLRRTTLKFSDKTTLEVLQSITGNSRLVGVLTAQYGDYGLTPSKSSFYMHALLVNHYIDGAAYPVGGASKLAETIAPIINTSGGAILYGAKVANIIVENNKAVGVRMCDGEKFFGRAIVSAAGFVNTYSNLLPEQAIKDNALDKAVDEVQSSTAHIALYVGIKESAQTLNLPKCNYWIYPDDYDHDTVRANYLDLDSQLPVAFVSFPLRVQQVAATHALNLSAGVSYCKVFLGRSLSCRATLFN